MDADTDRRGFAVKQWPALIADSQGVTVIEYALIATLVFVVVASAFRFLGTSLAAAMSALAASL